MTGDQHFKEMFLSLSLQLAAARAKIDELEEELADLRATLESPSQDKEKT